MAIKKNCILCIIAMCLWGTPVYAEQVYRVAPGDTLSNIASTYGTTLDSLLGNNQYIVNPDLIHPGMVLIIPDSGRQYYVVRPGDTLSEISQKFGVTVPRLADINNISNIDLLYVGQILLIRYQPVEREELAAVENTLSPIANRFPDTFFFRGEPDGLRVALTFDDGPDRVETHTLLDVLQRYGVPATFFLLGRNVPENADVVERLVAEGHTVANHSTTHPDLRTLTSAQLRNELLTLENAVYDITGLRTALMRPTYGFINDDVLRQVRDMGYRAIQWSVDTKDWRDNDVDQVLINTMPSIRDGSIILMHDHPSVTKEVLPEIIHSLKSQGYTFVTVDELLGVNAYKP